MKQQGRNEPEYVGLKGFIRGDVARAGDRKLPKPPWYAPIYEKTGPTNWRPGKKQLEHKTPVVVKEQHLKHGGWGSYSGLLEVEVVDEPGTTVMISSSNFVAWPYWDCPSDQLSSGTPLIASVTPDTRAVDADGDWLAVKPTEKLLCGVSHGKRNDGVHCLLYRQWRNGYGGVGVHVPADHLQVVY